MNDVRSLLTPAAAALLAETGISTNSARIKENGASEKTPMRTFIDALPLAREKTGRLQAIEESVAVASERYERATPIWIRSAYLPYGSAAGEPRIMRPDK